MPRPVIKFMRDPVKAVIFYNMITAGKCDVLSAGHYPFKYLPNYVRKLKITFP